MSDNNSSPSSDVKPIGNIAGLTRYLRQDMLSGFLVFLIALPLCLGISLACGYPAIAGIFTAIVGSILTPLISNSELTIKGPAAGLIVIAIGCVESFGGDGALGGFTAEDMTAYRMALAVGVVAALLQIAFGLLRAGILGEFFPLSAVHGMLSAIGLIIMIKQIPVTLGVSAKGEPLEMLREIPNYIREANPAIAVIGLVSILIMFLWPLVKKRVPPLGAIPAPMMVLVVSIVLGSAFDLLHEHSYTLQNHQYQLGEQYLVKMPDRVFGMFDYIATPDFSAFTMHFGTAVKWSLMFFVIGSLESILSAKAVDLLDPWKRKTNLNRDVLAVGVGNLISALVGGLPMISEIVRSRANIDNGARTRFAGMWHGAFLLLCVALIPTVLHRIPLAALAAMLVYTGYRLAHPNEFVNVYRIGKEQLAIFLTTLIVVLATDLLIGVAAGIALKITIHLMNGVPLKSLFKPYIEVQEISADTSLIVAGESAVFSNWIPFRRQIENIGLVQRRNIVIDLANARLVDHSTMEKLEELSHEFQEEGLRFEITGLDAHRQLSDHALAARKQGLAWLRRVIVVADEAREDEVIHQLKAHGAVYYTSTPCYGMGPSLSEFGDSVPSNLVRIEVVGEPAFCETIVHALRRDVVHRQNILVFSDNVQVMRREQFAARPEAAAEQELART